MTNSAPILLRLCLAILLSSVSVSEAYSGVLSGGSSGVEAPRTIKAGSPVVIKLVAYVWGYSSPIKDRFTNLSLHYRLAGEKDYQSVMPQPVIVPDNWKNWAKSNPSYPKECEAFAFTVPPYKPGVQGTMEYYIDETFDGYVQNPTVGKIVLQP